MLKNNLFLSHHCRPTAAAELLGLGLTEKEQPNGSQQQN
jgi:hypothetical protein